LIIITSNEERALPDAFVRRCLVVCIELKKPGDELVHWLMERGKAHFKDVDDGVLEQAAILLSRDRQEAIEQQRSPKPGQAEYLDLVRAVLGLKPGDVAAQKALLDEVGKYTLNKHQGTG
jgi:MoxR-like ATPase